MIFDIRNIFENNAYNFKQVDFLTREIAKRMDSHLSYIKTNPQDILDIGCGKGEDLINLKLRYPKTVNIIGVDLAYNMLSQAVYKKKENIFNKFKKKFISRFEYLIQANFAQLPFLDNYFNLLWSNLALYLHPQPLIVFTEWHRVLKVGGLLIFSTFGPDTLKELHSTYKLAEKWLNLPKEKYIISFLDMHDLGDILINSGFETPVIDMELLTVSYTKPSDLINDICVLGLNIIDKQHISNKNYLEINTQDSSNFSSTILEQILINKFLDKKYMSFTFEIIYGHAWCKNNRFVRIFPKKM